MGWKEDGQAQSLCHLQGGSGIGSGSGLMLAGDGYDISLGSGATQLSPAPSSSWEHKLLKDHLLVKHPVYISGWPNASGSSPAEGRPVPVVYIQL